MIFNNNFREEYLLTNDDVLFTSKENQSTHFLLKIPTFKDIYFKNEILFFLNFLERDEEDLKKDFNLKDISIKNHFDYIYTIFVLSEKVKDLEEAKNIFLKALKFLLPDFNYENKLLFIKDNIILNNDILKEMRKILLLSLNKKITTIEDTDDEFTKIEKQARIRAEKIRKNSEKKGTKEDNSELKDMLISIIYEFPQYKIEDLFNLNLYTIYFLFGYVGKIANYEVSKIAAGNGLAKKHKYFIEK